MRKLVEKREKVGGRDKGNSRRRMLERMRGSMTSFVTRTANVAVAAATNIWDIKRD
jgi:hypothetical protein